MEDLAAFSLSASDHNEESAKQADNISKSLVCLTHVQQKAYNEQQKPNDRNSGIFLCLLFRNAHVCTVYFQLLSY